MDAEEMVRRLQLLARPSEARHGAVIEPMRQVLAEPAMRTLALCTLLAEAEEWPAVVTLLRSLPERPARETPLDGTDLSPREIGLLTEHGFATIGDVADAPIARIKNINGLGPLMFARIMDEVDRLLPERRRSRETDGERLERETDEAIAAGIAEGESLRGIAARLHVDFGRVRRLKVKLATPAARA